MTPLAVAAVAYLVAGLAVGLAAVHEWRRDPDWHPSPSDWWAALSPITLTLWPLAAAGILHRRLTRR